jgi:hypothetical protein
MRVNLSEALGDQDPSNSVTRSLMKARHEDSRFVNGCVKTTYEVPSAAFTTQEIQNHDFPSESMQALA